MTRCNNVKHKVIKLESVKNSSEEVTLKLPSYMAGKSNDETNFLHKL